MKMKEVLKQTGLTDRAVRLYVENGLVIPDYSQSYTGRKNLEFSEEDVKKLQNIALLRKADFSISDIHILSKGGEEAKNVIAEYKSEAEQMIRWKKQVLDALDELPADGEICIDSICEKLSKAVENRKIPAADNKLRGWRRGEVYFFRIVSILGLIIFLFTLLMFLLLYKASYKYTVFYPISFQLDTLILRLPFILLFISSLTVFIFYLKPKFTKIRRIIRVVISALMIFVLIASVLNVPKSFVLSLFVPPVYSQTSDPVNYLDIDSELDSYKDTIYKLFPATIPYGAKEGSTRWSPQETFPETTKYYYRYSNLIDSQFDIYAEWVLPEYAFDKIKEDTIEAPPFEVTALKSKGEWECVYFRDYDENNLNRDYVFLIFAYNENENALRYIYSYTMDAGGVDCFPYHLSLSW